MSCTAMSATPVERLEVLFAEMAELAGQRNAIDGRLVEIVAEIDRDELAGMTGARSVPGLVAWKLGVSASNAEKITAVARRAAQFPRCTAALRAGRLSVDQVGVIAANAADGSDAHYAQLAAVATVAQLRTAVNLAPRPDPDPTPAPSSIGTTSDATHTTWRIRLPHAESATVAAGLQSHQDALLAAWTRDHGDHGDHGGDHGGGGVGVGTVSVDGGVRAPVPPRPGRVEAFLSLVAAGWDAEVAARPHGQRTTVVIHVDVDRPAALHLGPVLPDADRRYLLCDATCEVWFHRDGQVIGAGRATRTIGRRLRRVLEHRDRCCVVPGCGATRGLHAHHLRHWEDGGATDPDNLVLVCPSHHRAHHRGAITLTGPAAHLLVTDAAGTPLTARSLARPPTRPPPAVPPCPGPTGERADWWYYDPYQPPPSTN